ncbi:NAD(P)/FAD-dependent oxidoreductase [Jannaschia sp. R86511]|uniref:NAD(P)/FAD-dependent oxidoreductase n=1 Tax=Jannaschia sp. R86511 TaxID=3093853 RepID=UPI0036D2D523
MRTNTSADPLVDLTHDVVVVGGGAAGLSGALTVSRAGRSVVVVDSGEPRNAPADAVHNYLGSEGVAPAELLARGRAEVSGYGGRAVEGLVSTVRRLDAGADGVSGAGDPDDDGDTARFEVHLADGRTLRARRLLVTTGLLDELPDVPGLAERWGHDVLHCPFCHGHEVRGQAVGVLATGPLSVHQALMWRGWTDDVTLFLNGAVEPDEQQWEQLAARDVAVVDERVTELVLTDDRVSGVRLGDGRVVPRQVLVTGTGLTARAPFLEALGLPLEDMEMAGAVVARRVPSGMTGSTTVPGVWVAGNVTDPMAQVIVAAAAGLMSGAAIVGDLLAEETALAVSRRRG